MTAQYTFVMKDLRKLVPPKREIRKGIWLSFYPGAKIGILGNNGAGKSTLLKIMAGADKDFLGEAWPAPGLKICYLVQEPQLDPNKTVKENVDEGVSHIRALLTKFEEVSTKLGEDMSEDKMNKLLDAQARLQDQIEAVNAWELDRQVAMALAALRCPLLSLPDMLLLVEPTNLLDTKTNTRQEKTHENNKSTNDANTHDRY